MRHKMSKMKEMTNNFYVIGKKNNQTSVSGADQEIPTLGSTYNAEHEVSSFRHYPLTRGLGLLGLLWRPMFDYFSYI